MCFHKHQYFTFLFLLMAQITMSQITVPGIPAGWSRDIDITTPLIEICNHPLIAAENKEHAPIQAGYILNLDTIDILKSGKWIQISEDQLLWTISIRVPHAPALNVYFHDLQLHTNDNLFIYNTSTNQVFGAYTEANNKPFLCTPFIEDETITIEYSTYETTKVLPFGISEVGVRLNPSGERGFGGAGSCEVHINCEEGNNWQQQKDGVARILVKEGNLTFWCTGTLINNVNVDGTPFFLTANHCGENADEIDYAQWMFYFNYQSGSCLQPVFEPELQTISGSELLSHSVSGTNAGSDFKLLLLGEPVPEEYNPYYNGWTQTETAASHGVTIHHPQGDVKMISTFTQPLISSGYNATADDPDGKYWRVYWSETENGHGVTEGGSSGSPLFNNDGLIVGSLTGGGSSCTFTESPDYYGKFSYSWNPSAFSDSTKNLSYWLDPDNTGVSSLKGSNLDTTSVAAWFNAEKTSIIVGESIVFENTSFGNISSYQWEFEGGDPSYSEAKDPGKVVYRNAGKFNVKLKVSSTLDQDSLVREAYINVLPNISPNPGNGIYILAFGGALPENLSISVFDSFGNKVDFSIIENNENYLSIDISNLRDGLYFIRFSSSEQNNTYKVILSK